ncbi:anti-sigma factor [Herbaspirillum sp. HC18]|nr:anti-sigma factor [Herbaspirillum sp. HC18]
MDHEELQALLPAYVDNELDVATAIALERHLDNCQDCRREYEQANAMRARVKQDGTYFNAPSHLAQRVAASLPEDRPHPGRFIRWNFSLFPARAAVATLAVAVAAWSTSLYLRLPSASDQLAEEVIASHVRSLQVDHLSDIASTDRHTVKPWFTGRLDFSPPVIDLAPQGFPLIGGRLDYLNGRAVAALIYRRHLHPINLYVWRSADEESAVRVQERRGYYLAHWTSHGMAYWAVSDVAANELEDFAQLVRSAENP